MTLPKDATAARLDAIRSFTLAINGVLAEAPQSRAALRTIEAELRKLAARPELFPEAHFPRDGEASGALFELWVNESGTAALYFNVAWTDIVSPPHRHGTWAVIAGIEGIEPNQTYTEASGSGAPVALGRIDVGPGVSVSMLPDDVHSIHVHGPFPVRNLHFYGRSLASAGTRELYDTDKGMWQTYPAQVDVRQPAAG